MNYTYSIVKWCKFVNIWTCNAVCFQYMTQSQVYFLNFFISIGLHLKFGLKPVKIYLFVPSLEVKNSVRVILCSFDSDRKKNLPASIYPKKLWRTTKLFFFFFAVAQCIVEQPNMSQVTDTFFLVKAFHTRSYKKIQVGTVHTL